MKNKKQAKEGIFGLPFIYIPSKAGKKRCQKPAPDLLTKKLLGGVSWL